MGKDSIQKDTSANCGESKKSVVRKYPTHDNASQGESSTSTGKYGARNTDYDVALRLQHAIDEEYAHHRPTYAATRPHLHPANPTSTSIGNDDPPYPESIQHAVDTVQRFIATVMKTKCHECRSGLILDFDVEQWFRDWSASRDQKHALSICAIPCPNNKCRASTCLGCGDRPRMGKFVGKHKIDGLVVDWCCESGRIFAIWALLCRYDQMELELQLLQHSQRKYQMPNHSEYGYDIDYLGPRRLPRGGYGAPVSPVLSFKQADSKTDKTTRLLLGLIIELLPLRNEHGKAVPPEISAMIELSLLQDRAAELLRNDSLQDTTSRARLYFALFEFFERLGKHPNTTHLVYEKRFAKKQSSGLLVISLPAVIGSKGKWKVGSAPGLILGDVEQMAASLISCMGNLAKQSQVLIKASQVASKEFGTAEGADLLEIANRVVELYDSMAAGQGGAQNMSKINFTTWEEYHQKHCIVTEDNILAHLVTKLANDARALNESPRNRIKRLVTEISEMSTSLPLNIFVKADTGRPDVMKCLIVGPEGTPYECGLFEFDIFCPATYPKSPPQVLLCTTAGGKIRFNPNIYANGKICLSLLGTFDAGPPESQWQPEKSTILSVLVSIQALILCENPYTNEPFQHTYMSFAEGRKWCRKYDCNIEAWTLRFAILDWLRRPSMRDGIWKDVVRTYFRFHATKILAVARKWAPNNRLIEAYDGRVDLGKKGFFLRIIHPVNLTKELEAALPSVRQ